MVTLRHALPRGRMCQQEGPSPPGSPVGSDRRQPLAANSPAMLAPSTTAGSPTADPDIARPLTRFEPAYNRDIGLLLGRTL